MYIPRVYLKLLHSFTVFVHILNAKRNLFSYYQCQSKCVLIKSSHVDYIHTAVIRTLMSNRFDSTLVEYFDRTLLCNFYASISCIGILKAGLSRKDFLYPLLM